MNITSIIARELDISERRVDAVLRLLDEGCTIPFIARYRKEATGALDEVQIAAISDKYDKLRELEKRKQTILTTIDEQGKLTPELRRRIEDSWNSTELEDIYAPYKPKRRTRAEVARQRGLEPLATYLLMQQNGDVTAKAKSFIDKEKGVETADDALQGAMDIIAEQVSEDERARNTIRNNFNHDAVITSKLIKGKDIDGQKYRDYFDFSEPLRRCVSHRLLAIRRGESEGILKVSISGDDDLCMERLNRQFVRNNSEAAKYVGEAVADSFKRLLKPQIETEFAASSKEVADQEAIKIFVKNLEQLLMSAQQRLRMEMVRVVPDQEKVANLKELCKTLQDDYSRLEKQIQMVLGFKSQPVVIDKFNTIFKLETIAFEKRGIPFTINVLEQKLTTTDGEDIVVGKINFTERAKRVFTVNKKDTYLAWDNSNWYFSSFEEKDFPIFLMIGDKNMPRAPKGFRGFFWPIEFLYAVKKLGWTGVSIIETFRGVDRSGRAIYSEHKETILFSQNLFEKIGA